MSKTKKLTDPTVPTLTAIADTALVTVLDPDSGAISTTDFATLKQAVRDSIQIGGRNYLLNSNQPHTNADYNIANFTYAETPVVGEKYIITIWGELAPGKNKFNALNGSSSGIYGNANIYKISDGVYRGVLPILLPPDSNHLMVYASPQFPNNGQSTITHIKMERGNIATDWSPAPEDLMGGGYKHHSYKSLRGYAERRAAA